MKRLFILVPLLLMAVFGVMARNEVRFHNEASDTLLLTELLGEGLQRSFASPEERVAFYGRQFVGKPYAAHTLEGEPEELTVNLDSLDCTTFVETALALAYTTGERRSSWRDFIYNLRRIRYRGGEIDGYPSRLHYISDWAVDNIHRGNLRDATRSFPRYSEITRTIDFMSANRDKYPALADSANFARIKSIENGYRLHRFPYVKTIDMGNKAIKAAFHNGDVVGFVTSLKNLDVTHMGIIVKETPNSDPYVLHASQKAGKVVISELPLADFMKRNRQFIGVRVFRLTE